MALIEVRKLTKLYRMGDSVVRALDGVDLTIESGEFVALIGPSGSGKSTMMHLLGCLDRPTSGKYFLNGQDVGRLSDRALAALRNKSIGFVFQTFNLINRTTAVDNVAVPMFYARKSNTRGPARKALEQVGLAHRARHRPNELSGGERQRVAIARAIVNDPVLLLADEPTGNLDTKTGEQIMQVFHDLNAQGVTIVLVTHEPDIAIQAKRIVAMRDGRIVSDRPADEVRAEMGLTAVSPAARVSMYDVAPAGREQPPAAARSEEPAEPPRLARGATASLVLGAIGPLLVIGAVLAVLAVQDQFDRTARVQPRPVMIAGSAAALGLVLAFVTGITAVWWGRGVLRRIQQEPGNWLGARRARAAVVLGGLAILAPFLIVVASQVMARGG